MHTAVILFTASKMPRVLPVVLMLYLPVVMPLDAVKKKLRL